MMKCAIPIIKNFDNPPEDGALYKTHEFCKNSFNNKCHEHYLVCSRAEGFYTCPYGFATFTSKNISTFNLYTSLRIKGVSNEKWIKKRIKKSTHIPLLDQSSLQEFVRENELNNAKQTYYINKIREFEKKENSVNSKKELLDDTLHELRRINKHLKKQAFFLNKELESENINIKLVQQKSKNILAAAELVSVRLNAYDFTLNPSLIETGPKLGMKLYKKFDKARYCLSLIAQERKININFTGTYNNSILAYEILEILPYILLENAIRYSSVGGTIDCEFVIDDSNSELAFIKIENLGPFIEESELKRLTEKGFRAKSVMNNIKGTGKGLYIVQLICDYHGFQLIINSDKVDDQFGKFCVKLVLN